MIRSVIFESKHPKKILKVSFRKFVVFKPQGCFLTLKESFEQLSANNTNVIEAFTKIKSIFSAPGGEMIKV